MSGTIKRTSDALVVQDLEVLNRSVVDYFSTVPEGDLSRAVINALEVGVFCLQRCSVVQDLDFVRGQMEALIGSMQTAVQSVPSTVEKELIEKIGVGPGQVLAPVLQAAKAVAGGLDEKITDVRKLLSEDMDPSKQTSVMGKALSEIKSMLDPKRIDSIQGALEAAVSTASSENGAIAITVKSVVADALKPLVDEVERLGKEIRGQEAAEEVLAQTTRKGLTYQEEVSSRLQLWAQAVGGSVEEVGKDNRPGDILVALTQNSLAATSLSIIVEARDRKCSVGRKAINDSMSRAMSERSARAGIFLSRSADGLAAEVGEWTEGACESGPWIATTERHLTTAMRLLVVLDQMRHVQESQPEVDVSSAVSQICRIRNALVRIKNVKRKVTDIRSSADDIQIDAEALRDEVRGALCALEDALRSPSTVLETKGSPV